VIKRIIILVVLLVGMEVQQGLAEEKAIITDKDIQKTFKNSGQSKDLNYVMAGKRRHIQAILDGFLLGDHQLILESVSDLESNMQLVSRNISVDSQNAIEVWQSMAHIMERARKLKQNIEKKDYQKAYADYSDIVSSCIQCHEAIRGWGKLEPEVIKTVVFEEPTKDVKS
jgi:hypothetical protein